MFRSALASLGGPSTLRRTFTSPSLPPGFARQFQTSSPALKKRRAHEVEEDFDTSDEVESDELGLFGDAEDVASPGAAVDRKTQRADIKRTITSVADTKGRERRTAASALRMGSLRKVVQLSDSPEEMEELRSLLRTWRVLGQKVSVRTASEIVGKSPFPWSSRANYAGRPGWHLMLLGEFREAAADKQAAAAIWADRIWRRSSSKTGYNVSIVRAPGCLHHPAAADPAVGFPEVSSASQQKLGAALASYTAAPSATSEASAST